MEVAEAKRLKALEDESGKLKRPLTDDLTSKVQAVGLQSYRALALSVSISSNGIAAGKNSHAVGDSGKNHNLRTKSCPVGKYDCVLRFRNQAIICMP